MNDMGAEGPGSAASSGESGNNALGGGTDVASIADSTVGGREDSGMAGGATFDFVEDVIAPGYSESSAAGVAVFVDAAAGDPPIWPADGDDRNGIATSDRLHIADLVQDESEEGGSLASFLRFTFDSSTNSTVLNVSSTGHVDTEVEQQIVLHGVGDLTGHGTNSELSIITSLLQAQLQSDV